MPVPELAKKSSWARMRQSHWHLNVPPAQITTAPALLNNDLAAIQAPFHDPQSGWHRKIGEAEETKS